MPNASYSQEMSGYKISKPYFRMLTGGLLCRTRSLKLNFRLSRTDWIRREVNNSGSASIQNLTFSQRKRARLPPHLVSQAGSRNLCEVEVAELCRVR